MSTAKEIERLAKATENNLYLLVGLYDNNVNVYAEMIMHRAVTWCKHMGLDHTQITKHNKNRCYVQLRGTMMYALRYDCKMTSTEIARRMNRNHATVLYHCKEVEYQLAHYEDVQRLYRHLKHGI